VKDDPLAPVSTLRPWKNGSNMDINELQEGSTIFLPVFQRGGLIWTGDSHCRQGNGEVNLTALECSYKEIRIQPIVRKDMKVSWPFIETRTHWIATGFNEDLNVAMVNATREAVDWLANQKIVPMSRYEAYGLVSMAGDCRAGTSSRRSATRFGGRSSKRRTSSRSDRSVVPNGIFHKSHSANGGKDRCWHL